MKKYFLSALLIFTINIYSQEVITKAVYRDDFNSGIGLITSSYEMIFTNNESLYIDLTSDKESVYEKSNENDLEFNPKLIGETHPQFYYRNRHQKKITFNQTSLRKEYIIFEEEPLMKWKLIKESKKIGKFTCQKASTSFRGRDYIAWYTFEISVPYGPRKFGGLPGLIVEISDKSNKYTSRLIEITQEKNDDIKKNFDNYSSIQGISFDSFKNFFCEDVKKFEKMLISKMPRGRTMTSSSIGLGSDENLEIFDFKCEN